MNEINPSARIQVRGVGDLMHPGACAICGNGTRPEGFVDIGVYYDYEGQVYICMMCAEDLVHTIDGLTAEEHAMVKSISEGFAAENEALKTQVEELSAELKQYRDSIVSAFGSSVLPVPTLMGVPSTEVVDSGKSDSPEDGSIAEPVVTEVPRPKSVTVKSVTVTGRSDVNRDELSDGAASTASAGTIQL